MANPKHLSKKVKKKSREVWKPDSIFLFSSNFCDIYFCLEIAQIIFHKVCLALCSILIILLWKGHALRIHKIHIVLSSERRYIYICVYICSAYGPSLTCGLVTRRAFDLKSDLFESTCLMDSPLE